MSPVNVPPVLRHTTVLATLTSSTNIFIISFPNKLLLQVFSYLNRSKPLDTPTRIDIDRLTMYGGSTLLYIREIAAAYPNVRHLVIRNKDPPCKSFENHTNETQGTFFFAPLFSELENTKVGNSYTHGYRAIRRAEVMNDDWGMRREVW